MEEEQGTPGEILSDLAVHWVSIYLLAINIS